MVKELKELSDKPSNTKELPEKAVKGLIKALEDVKKGRYTTLSSDKPSKAKEGK